MHATEILLVVLFFSHKYYLDQVFMFLFIDYVLCLKYRVSTFVRIIASMVSADMAQLVNLTIQYKQLQWRGLLKIGQECLKLDMKVILHFSSLCKIFSSIDLAFQSPQNRRFLIFSVKVDLFFSLVHLPQDFETVALHIYHVMCYCNTKWNRKL